jgi:hypothetical protein
VNYGLGMKSSQGAGTVFLKQNLLTIQRIKQHLAEIFTLVGYHPFFLAAFLS